MTQNDLHPYQKRLVNHFLEIEKAAAWVDMGLGKTVCTLTAISEMQRRQKISRTLVVAPLRVARSVWAEEIEKWDHLQMSIAFADSSNGAKSRQAAIDQDTDILTIGRDNLVWLVDQFVQKDKSGKLRQVREWPWDNIVLDESSSFKNRSSNRWRAMYRLAARNMYTRMQQLTGSPAPNGLLDVWAPMFLLDNGERLGRSLGAFRSRWFEPPNYEHPYTWKARDFAKAQIQGRLHDLVMSMQAEDYLQLPPVLHNWIDVHLSSKEWKQYQELQKNCVLQLMTGGQIVAVNRGVLASKLQQLANGAVYDAQSNYHVVHDAKLKALLEIIEGAEGRPVMICYAFKHDAFRIAKMLASKKIIWRKLDRKQDEDDWNSGKIQALLLHPASAGHGLNLQYGGDILVWFGGTHNLEHYNQAIARLAGGHRRTGRNVVIHHIVAPGTADDDIQENLTRKDATEQSLMRAMDRRIDALISSVIGNEVSQ